MFEATKSLDAIRESLEKNSGESPWTRLREATEKMSPEQVSWTLEQPEVKSAWEVLSRNFNSWLFERFKEEFSKEPTSQPLIDSYISSVLTSAEGFGKRAKSLEEENARLKARLAALEGL